MLQSLEASLFENVPVALIYFDANLRLCEMNRQAELLFAHERNTLLGHPAADLGAAGIDEALLRQALGGSEVKRTLPHGADANLHLEVTCTPIAAGRNRGGVLLTALPLAGRETTPLPPARESRSPGDELWAVLDNLSEGVWLIEPDGSPRYRNPAGRQLLGIGNDTPDQHISNYDALDLRYSDGRAVPLTDLPRYRAARGERVRGMEIYLTGLDGVRRLLQVDTNALSDAQGNVLLGFNLMRDITAQRELEDEFKRSRDESQAIIENLAEGVTLMDQDGRMRYTNRAGRILLGWGTDNQGYETLAEYTALPLLYPDGSPIPAAELPLNRSLRGETFADFEMIYTGPNGVSRLLSIGGSRIKGNDGRYVAINVFRDITSQREIESQIADLLVQSEAERQRLFSVIDQMPEGVLIVTAQGGGLYAMNSTARELLQMELVDLTPGSSGYEGLHVFAMGGEEWLAPVRPIARALQGETLIGIQMRVQHADGSSVDLLVNASPLYDRSGKQPLISGAISVFQDISELKELDRLKDDFISITSHELRTPLTTIKGYGQMVTRKLAKLDPANPLRDELQKPVATILERTERMIAMINDLLDVSRIATGRFEVMGGALNLVDVVAKCIEQTQAILSLPIQLLMPEEPLPVVGEERLIEQVLNNLLGNAVKYSPQGGTISVTVHCQDGEATVSVADQGIGIAAEQQEHLFERFYRSTRSKDIASGLGLGLYISAGIIAAHGGRIWVTSEGAGKGATFSFALPLAV